MEAFAYRNKEIYCEDVLLSRLAEEVGTPLYIYSNLALVERADAFVSAFRGYPTLSCFAVKANSNLSLLKIIFSRGLGADVVSRGELERALLAGAPPARIVFSGVGKSQEEIGRALEVGIRSFNVESPGELHRIEAMAATRSMVAPVSLRINPNVDAKTHPHIRTGLYSTKFGIAEEAVKQLVEGWNQFPHLKLVGIACHIGSQILELGPFRQAAERMAAMAKEFVRQGIGLQFVDMGGGLGIRYEGDSPPSLSDYAHVLIEAIRPTGLNLIIEPGRAVVGEAGGLLTRVLELKKTPEKNFMIVDAAMTELIRPSLYDAFHEIKPVRLSSEPLLVVDIVGPVCESTDFLGKERKLPPATSGDLLLIQATGAYGSSMGSQYNSRPRSPEVLVEGKTYRLIRRRERLDELWEAEKELL